MGSVGLGDFDQRGYRHVSPTPQIVDGYKRLSGTGRDDRRGVLVGQRSHHAKTQPHSEAMIARWLKRAIPA